MIMSGGSLGKTSGCMWCSAAAGLDLLPADEALEILLSLVWNSAVSASSSHTSLSGARTLLCALNKRRWRSCSNSSSVVSPPSPSPSPPLALSYSPSSLTCSSSKSSSSILTSSTSSSSSSCAQQSWSSDPLKEVRKRVSLLAGPWTTMAEAAEEKTGVSGTVLWPSSSSLVVVLSKMVPPSSAPSS